MIFQRTNESNIFERRKIIPDKSACWWLIKVNKFVYKIRVLRAFHGERLGIIGRKIDYSPDAHTGNESGEINVKRVTKKKKKGLYI